MMARNLKASWQDTNITGDERNRKQKTNCFNLVQSSKLTNKYFCRNKIK